jgi:hypothetical protein
MRKSKPPRVPKAKLRSPATSGLTSALTREDRLLFKRLRISEELLRSAGVRRVTNFQARKLGFRFGPGDLSGIVFPYFDLEGLPTNASVRRDNPGLDEKGKPEAKYLSVPKKKRLLYLPPGAAKALEREDAQVIIVESEKAALAITAAAVRAKKKNLVAVATGGCWGWRGKINSDDPDTGPLPDLKLAGDRDVAICFDSDVEANPNVRDAERAFAAYLLGPLDARVSCLRVPSVEGVNGPDDYLEKKGDAAFWKLLNNPVLPWLDMFASYEDMKDAKPPQFIIKGFIQDRSINFFGGLPAQGKTLVLLSIVHSLLTGEKLFGYFDVVDKSSRIVYLTPEITLGSCYGRMKLFRLGPFLESKQLLVRTMSEGKTPELTDPDLLLAVKGADVFLDTAIRWIKGDESSASDIQKGLATGMFALEQAGARSVNVAHHATKSSGRNTDNLTLESSLRGSGDIAATASTVWAVRQVNREKNLIYIDNVKARDFEPCPQFQIQARPYLDEEGRIRMYAKPGECENLSELLPKKKGRPLDEEKQARIKLVGECVDKKMSDDEILERIKKEGMREIKRGTLKKDKQDAKASRPPAERPKKY